MTRRRSALAFPALLLGATLATGCLFPSIDDLTRCPNGCGGAKTTSGTGSPTGTGTATGPVTTTTTGAGGGSACPSTRGPAGVFIASENGFPSFCIDQTEVSVGDYRAFYEGNNFPLAPTLIPPHCSWKGTAAAGYRPMGHGPGGQVVDYIWGHFDTKTEENRPVQGLDWCDAATYCAWAGKRLCGSDMPANRHIDSTQTMWAHAGEWFRACAGPTGTPYPYGATFNATACNEGGVGTDPDPFKTANVDMPSTCVAAWPAGNVFDLLGNVAEYEDDCVDGSGATEAQDVCHVRGGPYPLSGNYNTCDYYQAAVPDLRGDKGDYNGARCCW